MAAPQSTGRPPADGGNLLTQRLGPLATWVWLIIGTVLIGIIYIFMKKKQGSSPATGQATPGQTTGVQNVPDIILQNYQGSNTQTVGPTTVNTTEPPVVPPSQPPPIKDPGPPPDNDTPPPPGKKPPAKPPAKKPAAKYQWVTVGRWTSVPGKKNLAPWNSTLWGIATHYGVKGGYQELAKLNGIANPNLIHPGQKIKVPV